MTDATYIISTGRSRTDAKWLPREVSWTQLQDLLREPRRTAESAAEYRSWAKPKRDRAKDIGGFVGGALEGGKRSARTVRSRSLITLDIDYGKPDTLDVIADALAGQRWALYSTHSHTAGSPRYRLIIPLSRAVSPDEYVPAARRIAERIGIDLFDDSTYQPERLMYWPSCPRDAEYVYRCADGEDTDPSELLATYRDWRDASQWPLSSRVTRAVSRHSRAQEDPESKQGIVGAFCRTYSISGAIDAFLSEVYGPCGPGRYTYLPGTTTGGAVAYEDKWLYSHHGTDPCCDKEVNAFDLVRIHLYGEEDAESDPDTPVNRLPSYLAMCRMAEADTRTRITLTQERMAVMQDFAGDGPQGSGKADEDESWKARVEFDRKGGLVATPANYGLILENDPRIKGLVRFDVFTGHKVLQRQAPWPRPGRDELWENSDYDQLIKWISESYGGSPVVKTTLIDAFNAVVHQTAYHPVRDYLDSLPEWDSVERIDTLLSDWLGAPDDPLTRAMTRKHLVAAVARIMKPGVKYDYILTLVGREALGKSTLVRKLGGPWFSDSFSSADIGSKDSMEQLRGKWLIEMGELKDYKKSTVETFKAFVSKQEDQFRPAYGRDSETYRRQCVFFATTNERAFLKGDTGNRRFWVVEVGVNEPTDNIKQDVFPRDQIWAEALYYYNKGETIWLDDELEALARNRQEEHNEVSEDERAGMIAEYIRKPIPEGWYTRGRDERRKYYQDNIVLAEGAPSQRRTYVCVAEVMEECLGIPYEQYKARAVAQILRRLGLEQNGKTGRGDRVYGRQKRFVVPDSFYDDADGYLK